MEKDQLSDFDLIQELLIMQKNKALLNRKRGLKDDMKRVIEKYLKKEAETLFKVNQSAKNSYL